MWRFTHHVPCNKSISQESEECDVLFAPEMPYLLARNVALSSIAFLEVMMVEGLSFVVLGRVFFLKSRLVDSQTQEVLLHLAAVTCMCTCTRVYLHVFTVKSCRSSRSTCVRHEVLLQQ